MARPRPPRERETAPGEQPGAESFARAAHDDAPQGIVRLSDLFSPGDFHSESGRAMARSAASGGARRKKSASVRHTHGDGTGREMPTVGGGESTRLSDRRIGTASGAQRSAAMDTGFDASLRVTAEGHRTSDDARHAPSRRDTSPNSLASGGVPQGAHLPSSEHRLDDTPPDPQDAGPAYESLFGDAADTRRRPRRERKPATALQRALGLLTRREHSRKELTRKLVSRGVDAAEVEAAVDRLSGAGWQDDRRFADSLVRSRAAAGYGPLHIRAELGTHDLPAEIRQAAFDDFDGDWGQLARDAVQRRFGRIGDDRLRERKAADWLLRRGFPSDIVRAASRFHADD